MRFGNAGTYLLPCVPSSGGHPDFEIHPSLWRSQSRRLRSQPSGVRASEEAPVPQSLLGRLIRHGIISLRSHACLKIALRVSTRESRARYGLGFVGKAWEANRGLRRAAERDPSFAK